MPLGERGVDGRVEKLGVGPGRRRRQSLDHSSSLGRREKQKKKKKKQRYDEAHPEAVSARGHALSAADHSRRVRAGQEVASSANAGDPAAPEGLQKRVSGELRERGRGGGGGAKKD